MAIPLAQEIIFGLVIGSYIALGAIGFTLVYGLVNMINFAHGEFITIGAYVGFVAVHFGGLPLPVALLVAFAVTAVAGWAIARVTFEPMNDAGAVPLLLTSIGLGLVLRNVFRLVAGARGRDVSVPVATRSPISRMSATASSVEDCTSSMSCAISSVASSVSSASRW